MPALPDSLSLATLLQGEFPGDITLGESKIILQNIPSTKNLHNALAKSKPAFKGLVIRFVDENLNDLPDSMTLSALRALMDIKKASIIVEEGGGGSKQPTELVH